MDFDEKMLRLLVVFHTGVMVGGAAMIVIGVIVWAAVVPWGWTISIAGVFCLLFSSWQRIVVKKRLLRYE